MLWLALIGLLISQCQGARQLAAANRRASEEADAQAAVKSDLESANGALKTANEKLDALESALSEVPACLKNDRLLEQVIAQHLEFATSLVLGPETSWRDPASTSNRSSEALLARSRSRTSCRGSTDSVPSWLPSGWDLPANAPIVKAGTRTLGFSWSNRPLGGASLDCPAGSKSWKLSGPTAHPQL